MRIRQHNRASNWWTSDEATLNNNGHLHSILELLKERCVLQNMVYYQPRYFTCFAQNKKAPREELDPARETRVSWSKCSCRRASSRPTPAQQQPLSSHFCDAGQCLGDRLDTRERKNQGVTIAFVQACSYKWSPCSEVQAKEETAKRARKECLTA